MSVDAGTVLSNLGALAAVDPRGQTVKDKELIHRCTLHMYVFYCD